MAKTDETTTPDEAYVDVASTGNCKGELKQLPSRPGSTVSVYECEACHQLVHVGQEDLEANGLPPEHSPTPAAE